MQDLSNKVTGNSLTAAEWNEIPSEIQNAIESSGQALSSGDLNQLRKASNIVLNTLTDLRNLSSGAGTVFINGHTNVGTGGGQFYWDATSTATDDNGFTIKLTSVTTGRYKRVDKDYVTIDMFGAVSPGVVATNSAAIHAAIAFVDANKGGTVWVPPELYNTEDLTYGSSKNVTIQGMSHGYDYGSTKQVSLFSSVSGDFGIRMPDTCSYPVLRNVSFFSDGALNVTAPHVVVTAGTEYGVLVECGQSIVERVTVYGFQYGCVQANLGNSNIYEKCAFMWNTKVGFACTKGTAAAYAALHPNITAPSFFLVNTYYTFRDCNVRRNGWGMILRDGTIRATNVLVENNFFGGVMQYKGSLDSGVSGAWEKLYLENNFSAYTDTVAYTITQNNLLKETASTWINWTLTSGVTATNDPGYQFYMMSLNSGTNEGPLSQTFRNTAIVQTGTIKGLYLKSCRTTRFELAQSSGGDQTNSIRLGDGSFTATATIFQDFEGTLPATLGSSGCLITSERTLEPGGFTASKGYFRGLHGSLVFPDTQVPVAHAYTLDDYRELPWTPVITSSSGTLTTITGESGRYTKIGDTVFCDFAFTITTNGTGASRLRITVPLTGALRGHGIGREQTASGFTITLFQNGANFTYLEIVKATDDTYPGLDAGVYTGSFNYKV